MRCVAEVNADGEIALPRLALRQGTSVEVIVLIQDAPDDARDLLSASESSLSFWDNDMDDRIWNNV
ncbi:MAG: hypothetical protein JO250_19720 [Armatimonadetes bacterium]|nr:hypothetical protein [Armatimonadota bacterium]